MARGNQQQLRQALVIIVTHYITTIILLGRAGVLHAFCPHLGTHLGHGGTVQGNNIVCPYHSWEFDADGRNKWGRPPCFPATPSRFDDPGGFRCIPYCHRDYKDSKRIDARKYPTRERRRYKPNPNPNT